MRSFDWFLLFSLLFQVTINGEFLFTNIMIKSIDPDWSKVDYCHIKAVNRTFKYMSFRLRLKQLPVTNLKVNYALLKRSNGYRPFLYNFTVDICHFFVATKKHVVNRFIYTWFKDYTNFNHSCPYNNDIYLEKFPTVSWGYMDLLPMPAGDYAIDSYWFTNSILRFTGKIFFTFK